MNFRSRPSRITLPHTRGVMCPLFLEPKPPSDTPAVSRRPREFRNVLFPLYRFAISIPRYGVSILPLRDHWDIGRSFKLSIRVACKDNCDVERWEVVEGNVRGEARLGGLRRWNERCYLGLELDARCFEMGISRSVRWQCEEGPVTGKDRAGNGLW
jgi:hypothetical protein